MERIEFRHRAPDGAEIFVQGWVPTSPKAIVHVFHGMSEHGARYERLALRLVDKGYAVYAQDHRGHGRSIPPGEEAGHFGDHDGWNLVVRDAHAINGALRDRHPNLPMIGLGHSMGSFIMQNVLIDYPDDLMAVMLSASNGKPPPLVHVARLIARIETKRLGRRGISPILQKLTFGDFNKAFAPNRTESDWLSRDEAEVDKYVADPLCGLPATNATWGAFFEGLVYINKPENVAKIRKNVPIYIFSGDRDPVGENGIGVRRLYAAYQVAKIEDLTFRLYEGGRHEMLNEVNRDEVMQHIVDWCESVMEKRVQPT